MGHFSPVIRPTQQSHSRAAEAADDFSGSRDGCIVTSLRQAQSDVTRGNRQLEEMWRAIIADVDEACAFS